MIQINAEFVAQYLSAEEIAQALELRLQSEAADRARAEADAVQAQANADRLADVARDAQARAQEVAANTAARIPAIEALRAAAGAVTFTAREPWPLTASGHPVAPGSRAGMAYIERSRRNAAQQRD